MWLFLHSGSRGVGNRLAQQHIKVAAGAVRERGGSSCPTATSRTWSRATPEFDAVHRDAALGAAVRLLNREEMMDRVVDQLGRFLGTESSAPSASTATTTTPSARRTSGARCGCPGRARSTPRDGPARAHPRARWVTASYVVVGKGNVLSLISSPHGAGRNYSRSAARQAFTRGRPRREAWPASRGGTPTRSSTSTPTRTSTIDGHGRRRRPRRGAAHAAADRQRQGRLTPWPALPRELRPRLASGVGCALTALGRSVPAARPTPPPGL